MMSPEVPRMAAQPIARFRAGQISCAIWENEIQVNGTTKTVLKASVSRRYFRDLRVLTSSSSGLVAGWWCLDRLME